MIRSALVFLLLMGCNDKKENKKEPDETPLRNDTVIRTPIAPSMNSYVPVDISPMDMSYYPVDYPISKMGKATATPPLARVIYSRPHLQGRHVFHEVLKYGEPWRLGANESTELQLFSDATIQGKPVKAGRYVLYCIPQPKEWKIILNNNTDSWGLRPEPAQDVASFIVPVETSAGSLEYFTIVFEPAETGANLLMAWDNVEVKLPIRF